MEYFVESNSVRSEVFKLNVVDLPYVKQLDLTLNFPRFHESADERQSKTAATSLP